MAKPIIAKDALGNILAVGDDVLTITGTHDPFTRGEITRFTPKMADMKRTGTGYRRSMRQFHYQLIKVSSLVDEKKLLLDFLIDLSKKVTILSDDDVSKEQLVEDYLLNK